MAIQIATIEGKNYWIYTSSDVIESKGSKGAKFWQAHVVNDEKNWYTTTSAWHETKDGTSKVTWAVPRLGKPKNVGKKNETTSQQQAISEFESMVEIEQRKRLGNRVMPMLAKTFIDKREPKKSRRDKIKYPAIIQPKYDGNRVLCDGQVGWGRGNLNVLPHALAHILPVDTEGYILDGELLLPWDPTSGLPRPNVHHVNSAIKKFHPGVTDTLRYTVYDLAIVGDMPFTERWERLKDWYDRIGSKNPFIDIATSVKVPSEEQGLLVHARLTEDGYEGTIWRNMDGVYASDKRVDQLQKHKDFETKEFRIKKVIPQGEGIAERRAKFVCETDDGVEFESNAVGNEATQMGYLADAENIATMYAVVKFRETTHLGAPFHSNVLEVRRTKKGGY